MDPNSYLSGNYPQHPQQQYAPQAPYPQQPPQQPPRAQYPPQQQHSQQYPQAPQSQQYPHAQYPPQQPQYQYNAQYDNNAAMYDPYSSQPNLQQPPQQHSGYYDSNNNYTNTPNAADYASSFMGIPNATHHTEPSFPSLPFSQAAPTQQPDPNQNFNQIDSIMPAYLVNPANTPNTNPNAFIPQLIHPEAQPPVHQQVAVGNGNLPVGNNSNQPLNLDMGLPQSNAQQSTAAIQSNALPQKNQTSNKLKLKMTVEPTTKTVAAKGKSGAGGGGLLDKVSSKVGQLLDTASNHVYSGYDKYVQSQKTDVQLVPPSTAYLPDEAAEIPVSYNASEKEQLYYYFKNLIGIPIAAVNNTLPNNELVMNLHCFYRMFLPKPASAAYPNQVVVHGVPLRTTIDGYNDNISNIYATPFFYDTTQVVTMGIATTVRNNVQIECSIPIMIVDHLFHAAKWGNEQVTFPSFLKFLDLIFNRPLADKITLLYQILLDPHANAITKSHLIFVANSICTGIAKFLGQTDSTLPHYIRNVISSLEPMFQTVGTEYLNFDTWNHLLRESCYHDVAVNNTAITQLTGCWKYIFELFGLFPFLYMQIAQPIRHALTLDLQTWYAMQDLPRSLSKEGFLVKNSDLSNWKRKWVIVRGGFMIIFPSNNRYDSLERVLNLNECSLSLSNSNSDPHHCFTLTIGVYSRKFCAESEKSMNIWMAAIASNMWRAKPSEQLPITKGKWRENISARWFIDGKDTFNAMATAIENATTEIFITDWFITPEVFLRRNILTSGNQLMTILKKKADEGVNIYILPWSETKLAMELASNNAKEIFESLSPNIQVLCHPLAFPVKWSHHQKTLIIDQNVAFVGGLDMCLGRYDEQTHPVTDEKALLFPGKDYYNPSIAEFSGLTDVAKDLVDRSTMPRMPWHDVHMVCDGEAARDIAMNFIARWNHHKDDLQSAANCLTPKTTIYKSIGTTRCKMLRSVSNWSIGSVTTETSIHKAYNQLIEHAQHFIYIENQYFISSLSGGITENSVALSILTRVKKAIIHKERFRVIVIVPFHPEGSMENATTRYIMQFQYKTICRGRNSILGSLRSDFPELSNADINKYISFHCVRNYGRLGNNFVSEQIYVHAKLLIVDDTYTIIGSANINDRSMLGNRDSEIAMLVDDADKIAITMNGNPFNASRFAHDLRVNLWLEHLGLSANEANIILDPLSEQAYNLWTSTSATNSAIYSKTFVAIRDQKSIPIKFNEAVTQIRGHLVNMDEDLISQSECTPDSSNIDISLAGDDTFT